MVTGLYVPVRGAPVKNGFSARSKFWPKDDLPPPGFGLKTTGREHLAIYKLSDTRILETGQDLLFTLGTNSANPHEIVTINSRN